MLSCFGCEREGAGRAVGRLGCAASLAVGRASPGAANVPRRGGCGGDWRANVPGAAMCRGKCATARSAESVACCAVCRQRGFPADGQSGLFMQRLAGGCLMRGGGANAVGRGPRNATFTNSRPPWPSERAAPRCHQPRWPSPSGQPPGPHVLAAACGLVVAGPWRGMVWGGRARGGVVVVARRRPRVVAQGRQPAGAGHGRFDTG